MKRLALLALLVLAPTAAGSSQTSTMAIVTAEKQNEVLAVRLPAGNVVRRVHVPADPENVAVGLDKVVVASPRAGAVTLLDRHLRKLKVLRGFGSPHIVLVDPLRTIAYVTDDARGELDVIALGQQRIVGRLSVGLGAHHMALSPGSGHRLWVALGEHARELVLVDVTNPLRPWVVRRVSIPFVAHDLAYAHNGLRIWVTSAVGSTVHVLGARTGSAVAAIRVGPAPQHVAFDDKGRFAFVTSGYSSRLLKVNARTGRVVASVRVPYGSFNLVTFGSLVVTSSLLNGRLTELDLDLKRTSSSRPAPAARAVAITLW
jgi:DNA-binding beta-propeller fold protein YncE